MSHTLQRFSGFSIRENGLWLSDRTEGNASTTKHGLLPKLSGNAAQYLDGSGAFSTPPGSGGAANHAFYTYKAAALEPLAYEVVQHSTFSYAISGTKLLMAAWNVRIGASGRMDIRDLAFPLPISNQTLVGNASGTTHSTAAIIDPALASYTDARTTYYDRLNALAAATLKYLPLTAPLTLHPCPAGPYGTIIVHTTTYDFAWIGPSADGGSNTFPITYEIGDNANQSQRVTTNHPIPVFKGMMGGIRTGNEASAGVGKGFVLYYLCPASWGVVVDGTTYIFRDDFMGASLNTGSTWTRTQSTAGNVEINTDFAWCKALGNGTWAQNGAVSQASMSRVTGKVFMCDVLIGSATPNLIVGWHDGTGIDQTDFSHGLQFSVNGSAVRKIYVRENAAAAQETTGYTPNALYRVRITLNGNAATYEIQGGPEYAAVGGSTWSTLTPGSGSSSSTTPLYAGFTIKEAVTCYVGDVKTY